MLKSVHFHSSTKLQKLIATTWNSALRQKARALGVSLQDPPTMAATHESHALLAAVRSLDICDAVSDVEIEETRAALRDARVMLANPLAYPAKKTEDRAKIKQGVVEVRGREVRLGALDIDNALMLRYVYGSRSCVLWGSGDRVGSVTPPHIEHTSRCH